MRKLLLIAALVVGALIVGGVLLLLGMYRALHRVEPWYAEALEIEPTEGARAGDELEKRVLDLRNDARRGGRWEAVITDEQINGYLAVDLLESFADVLPDGVSDPRVAIGDGRAQLACRYRGESLSTVLSLTVEAYLTDEPNVAALRICSARAGALRLPLKSVLEEISNKAEEADLPLRWVQKDGDPVALVTIPERHDEFPGRLRVEKIELRRGEIHLAGRTEPLPE